MSSNRPIRYIGALLTYVTDILRSRARVALDTTACVSRPVGDRCKLKWHRGLELCISNDFAKLSHPRNVNESTITSAALVWRGWPSVPATSRSEKDRSCVDFKIARATESLARYPSLPSTFAKTLHWDNVYRNATKISLSKSFTDTTIISRKIERLTGLTIILYFQKINEAERNDVVNTINVTNVRRYEESNVKSDKMRMNDRGIREWRCIGNRTGSVYSMMMMLLRQPVSPRAVGARCGKISLFYEWKSCLSCLSVCVLVGRNSESIPTVTLNHHGCSKRRRNATVQRRRINRREYVLLIRMENFRACKTVAFIFRLKILRYSKCNLVLILFLVWFQLWSVRMRYLKAERNFHSDYQKKYE